MPLIYTDEQIETAKALILDKLAQGHSLTKVLKSKAYKGLPSRKIVYQWLNPNEPNYDFTFRNNYASAREDAADLHADQIEAIVKKAEKGDIEPSSARVAIDGYKWLAGRKKPKVYGDRIDVTSGGEAIEQQIHIIELPDNGRKIKKRNE